MDLEEEGGGRILAPKHKEVSMKDRDNRSKHEQSGSSSHDKGSSGRPGQSREGEGRSSQSKHTQGSENPPRDDKGQFESEHSGSQGTSRRGSSDEEDTE